MVGPVQYSLWIMVCELYKNVSVGGFKNSRKYCMRKIQAMHQLRKIHAEKWKLCNVFLLKDHSCISPQRKKVFQAVTLNSSVSHVDLWQGSFHTVVLAVFPFLAAS